MASVLLHGGLIAAFLLLRSPVSPPAPQMIMVRTFAAPAGDRAIGTVQAAPTAVETPPPVTKSAPPKPVVPAAKAKPAPPKATQTAAPKPPEAKPQPAPAAGGGATGGRGADVANIDTPGLEFPFPWYTTNIVNRLLRRFGEFSGRLSAEVRFVIRRDGSVDTQTIKIVTSSGNYSFDQRALGAVEAAANAKEFGALPPGFREDILPVTFRFSPTGTR